MQKLFTVTTNSSPWFGRTGATFLITLLCWIRGFDISWRTARLKAGGYALDIHWADGSIDKIVDVQSETTVTVRRRKFLLKKLKRWLQLTTHVWRFAIASAFSTLKRRHT